MLSTAHKIVLGFGLTTLSLLLPPPSKALTYFLNGTARTSSGDQGGCGNNTTLGTFSGNIDVIVAPSNGNGNIYEGNLTWTKAAGLPSGCTSTLVPDSVTWNNVSVFIANTSSNNASVVLFTGLPYNSAINGTTPNIQFVTNAPILNVAGDNPDFDRTSNSNLFNCTSSKLNPLAFNSSSWCDNQGFQKFNIVGGSFAVPSPFSALALSPIVALIKLRKRYSNQAQ
jgi:hypothetical protein